MTEPSQKLVDLDFIVSRIGMPAVILGAMMWFHFHEFNAFRREMKWDMERSIRNSRAIMQKEGIPIIFEGDKTDKKGDLP